MIWNFILDCNLGSSFWLKSITFDIIIKISLLPDVNLSNMLYKKSPSFKNLSISSNIIIFVGSFSSLLFT